jgi:DNA adenine methylase
MSTLQAASWLAKRYLRPAVKTHGGKRYLARGIIIPRLPDHEVYIEPYAGGLNVLLNKRPAAVEVANDLDGRLMRFYRVLVNRTAEFLERVAPLVYSEATFDWSRTEGDPGDEVDAAVRFYARNRQSRDGLGEDFSWSERLRGGRPGDLNAWETIKPVLPRIADRLANVELRCRDAVEVIEEFDGPRTLQYLDPTYPHETRTATDIYDHEMTEADHARLLETIVRCRGAVIISGYDNAMYNEALQDWERVEKPMKKHAAQTRIKPDCVEVLWLRNCGG